MKKKFLGGVLAVSLFVAGVTPAISSAQDATSTEEVNTIVQLQAQIQQLLAQIQQIKDQISQLQGQQGTLQQQVQALRLEARQLREGLSGEDVKLLQETLATDPSIYPQGLITGFFGPLTKAAVLKFQAKFGIDQIGEVGPQTRARINQLLAEGAGNSGKVPPGLLIAPGIAKKLGGSPAVPEGQKLPPGIAKKLGQPGDDDDDDDNASSTDTTAPVISGVGAAASSTMATVSWTTDEDADGKVWYGTSTPVVAEAPFLSVNHADLKKSHSLELTGLAAFSTYNFMVVSKDEAGNTASSTEASFTTTGE